MPAHLTAQYRNAEACFRAARTHEERRVGLEQMLAAIPRLPGTEKLQADIKRRLAELRQEVERQTRGRARAVHVDHEGAAQVLLLGCPNSGKSSLLAALTRAQPEIAAYPYSTTRPQPGLMLFEDVQIQLVDLPAVTSEHMDPWIPGIARAADGALLFADPTTPGVLAGIEEVLDRLAAARTPLVGRLPADADPGDQPLPTLLVISKIDLAGEEDAAVLEELYGDQFPIVRYSAATGTGKLTLKSAVWNMLELVRISTKKAGQKLERTDPFVLPRGSAVLDLAVRVDPALADRITAARVWGGKLDGQKVGRDFELRDRDVVELQS